MASIRGCHYLLYADLMLTIFPVDKSLSGIQQDLISLFVCLCTLWFLSLSSLFSFFCFTARMWDTSRTLGDFSSKKWRKVKWMMRWQGSFWLQLKIASWCAALGSDLHENDESRHSPVGTARELVDISPNTARCAWWGVVVIRSRSWCEGMFLGGERD